MPRTNAIAFLALVVSITTVTASEPTAAEAACTTESEPNDTEQAATTLAGPICFEGTLPGGDQDLVLWSVGPEDATTRWNVTLGGVAGTLTLLQFFAVTSPPGDAVVTDRLPLLETTIAPDDIDPATVDGLLLAPGRYLLATARSALPDGGEPDATDYRLSIERGMPWPPSADVEPNDDADSAQQVADAFETSGDRQGSWSDVYAWTVGESGRWEVAVSGPLGESIWFDLRDADGAVLDSINAETEARLYDLALEAGTYSIHVPETGIEPSPYILSAVPGAQDGDAEPNDGVFLADRLAIADGEPARGRLAKEGDTDRFTLTVSSGPPMLRDVRMLWRSGADRSLCLLDETGARTACQRGTEGLALTNLLLRPGDHTFEVSGPSDPADPYLLRVDATGPAVPDFETEPNGDVEGATIIDPSLGMRARGGPDDVDLFRLHTEGDAQLWQIDVSGSGIGRADLVRANGMTLSSADIAGDGSTAVLADLYLVPGDHWLRVDATGSEYAVTTRPLGPPDPDGELEPNDDPAIAGPYRIGSRRVGRLPTASDRDAYRFTLAAPQRVRLDIAQPADAATGVRISRDDELLLELAGLPDGDPISIELWLEAGDHLIELEPERPSDGTYELTSARLDPYAPAVDREPNDLPAWARPVPPTLSWSGGATDLRDQDWYLLPPTSTEDPLRIGVDGFIASVRLSAADGSLESGRPIGLDRVAEDTFVSSEALPLDVPLLLAIEADGDYAISLEGAGSFPATEPTEAALEMDWQLPVDTVAAYWPEEQLIEAVLVVTNTGTAPLAVTLDTTTSHHQWRAVAERTDVLVAAGASVDVATSIVSGVDAWGTDPVLISARAMTTEGAQASASVEVRPSVAASPIDPRTGWAIPPELLGGLNVASLALGAVPGGLLDADQERRLFDGVTPEGPTGQASQVHGNGFSVFVGDHVEQLPIELEVDLAGDAAVPVAGTIINPQASEGELREVPREFELLLSPDGHEWISVLRDTLSPLRVDQAFVLDEPVAATHARLRIWSKYVDQGAYLSLGEWKVVAAPAAVVVAGSMDIADPALGGHVVAFEPFDATPDFGVGILDAGGERQMLDLGDARKVEIVVGFKDGRAAQVTALDWVDPDASDPAARLGRVEVSASVQGPAGPWRPLGSWALVRWPDGSVGPFEFEDPQWIRYLRLTAWGVPGEVSLELPGALRVMERASGGDYRSILGEWGYRSRAGPYEWLGSSDAMALDPGVDAGDGRAEATVLAAGTVVADGVEIDADEDWYWVDVPAGQDTLEVVVDGRPTVGVALTLFDEVGAEQELDFLTQPDGSVRYRAAVEPERRYAVRVEQPPFSAVFAFDTSNSMDPFLDMVIGGLRSYLADVRPGREVVTLLPFEEAPLAEGWQDDPYALQDAFENHVVEGGGSSGAEAALIAASNLLAEREGARAILLVTDAETTTADRTPELWDALGRARPAIFSVHIGALIEPISSRQRMQDWAASGGGHYTYPTTHGEMDRAFERMATWLRRPASYTLSYSTFDLTPAQLSVGTSSEAPGTSASSALAPGVGIEIILDTSGSMREKLGQKRRINIAKAAVRKLISETLTEDVPLAIRTFGRPGKGKAAACGSSLTLPLGPLDRDAALGIVNELTARKGVGTPIAASLEEIPQDLATVDRLRSVVLVTDGEESCDGDPAAVIAALRQAGIDVKLDIVGFALEDAEVRGVMAAWAEAGGGSYFDATNAAELARSIEQAVRAPFRVLDQDGEQVGLGTVEGEPVLLDPGTYHVEVLTDPAVVFSDVELVNGATVELQLPASDPAE